MGLGRPLSYLHDLQQSAGIIVPGDADVLRAHAKLNAREIHLVAQGRCAMCCPRAVMLMSCHTPSILELGPISLRECWHEDFKHATEWMK